jgi:c-di-GMP-binding flagellar brake protein YcgR
LKYGGGKEIGVFEAGKVYKVKVELAPGEVGFGRATIVEKTGSQLLIQLRTSKDTRSLAKGTRIWFVSDAPDVTFNGMWSSSIVGTQMAQGKSAIVCASPKLEPLLQRRRTPRVALDVPVKLLTAEGEEVKCDTRSKDISRSGIAIESAHALPETLEPGGNIKLVVQSSVGDIAATSRIIRIDKNWLANKSVVGLEFTELSQDAVAMLDKLLVLLGGKPRNEEAETEPPASGLSSLLGKKGGFEGSSKFTGGAKDSSSKLDKLQDKAQETNADSDG